MNRTLLRAHLALAVIVGANGCSTSTTPTAPPPAPSAAPRAALSIGTATGPAVGIADYSPLLFDAGASTGEGLTYRVEFGDGTESTASRATHVPVVAQTSAIVHNLVARLTVTDRLGRSDTVTQTYVVARLEFPYTHWSWYNSDKTGGRWLTFKLSGAQVTGTYAGPEGTRRAFTGTLSGERDIHLRLDDGTMELQGTVSMSPNGKSAVLKLSVRGGLADGRVLEFNFDDIY